VVVPSTLPVGEPAPSNGVLPAQSVACLGQRAFGIYVHVPYCTTRCGYCDFNTYTAAELGGGASQSSYPDNAIAELRLARGVLGDADLPVQSVFFGGGTPTVLPPAELARILAAVRDEFGLTNGAEVTTEANPESVDEAALNALRDAGFTRISFGMQSVVPHVLRVLDRKHTPGRVREVVTWARAAGFEGVSVDLIYGSPGESVADWQASLGEVLSIAPDHVSAYALIVEPGTRLATQVRRGDVTMPDDDETADKYVLAEETLTGAGFAWYELSNWAVTARQRCRHNLGYWQGADWWGVGPGAHSHVGGTRWWNVKHPTAYAARLGEGVSPAAARELLTDEDRRVERVLLGVRLAEGHPVSDLQPAGLAAAGRAVGDGLLEGDSLAAGRIRLTLRGRLLADAVVRDLVD
jgi:oxygen-independent coproporphyrinogen-3 oxidase